MGSRFAEYRFRRLIPISHDGFLDEPVEFVAWALRFAQIDDEIEAEAMKAKR